MQGCAFCSKNRNFTYPLISRDPKRSKFCKFLDLEKFSLDLAFNIRGHWESAYKNGLLGTEWSRDWWRMTSRDTERSRSWPLYVWCPLSRKWLEIATWWQWSTYRKWLPANQIVPWPITSRHVTLKGHVREPNTLRDQYLENSWR